MKVGGGMFERRGLLLAFMGDGLYGFVWISCVSACSFVGPLVGTAEGDIS